MEAREERIAFNFKRLRLKKGWTQEETAEKGGVTQGYVAKLENLFVTFGTRAEEKWAKIFGVDRSEFFRPTSNEIQGIPIIGHTEGFNLVQNNEIKSYLPLPPGYSQEEATIQEIGGVAIQENTPIIFKNGWHLYIKAVSVNEIRNGDYVFFHNSHGTRTLKEIELKNDIVIFKSLNGDGQMFARHISEITRIDRVFLILPP